MTPLIFFLGAALGSFICVVGQRRVSREDFILSRSRCNSCRKLIPIYYNIPILSYIFLKGRCCYCKTTISFDHFITEFILGALSLLLYYKFGLTVEYIYFLSVFSILCLLSICDFYEESIYIADVFLILAIFIVFSLLYNRSIKVSLINMITNIILFLGIYIISGGGMGEGDIYIAGILGLLTTNIFLNIHIMGFSFILAAVISIVLIALGIKKREDTIAFAPFLTLSYVLIFFIA